MNIFIYLNVLNLCTYLLINDSSMLLGVSIEHVTNVDFFLLGIFYIKNNLKVDFLEHDKDHSHS